MKLLILGGTGDAVKLAARLEQMNIPNLEIMTSLAGRTRKPSALVGNVRIGGFGGAVGLANYLKTEKVDFLIDATHPCAGQISENGAIACQVTKIPHLMLVRPQWQRVVGDRWHEVKSVEEAAQIILSLGKRIFITSGRQQLQPFLNLALSNSQLWFLIRSIDPPDLEIPNSEILLDRGPFKLEQERQLLKEQQIEVIVSKNSGGADTAAKLTAARELNIPIIMIQRPELPEGEKVDSIDGAIAWLSQYIY